MHATTFHRPMAGERAEDPSPMRGRGSGLAWGKGPPVPEGLLNSAPINERSVLTSIGFGSAMQITSLVRRPLLLLASFSLNYSGILVVDAPAKCTLASVRVAESIQPNHLQVFVGDGHPAFRLCLRELILAAIMLK